MKVRLLNKKQMFFGKVEINSVVKYYPTYNIKREGKTFGLGFLELDFTKYFKVNIKVGNN